VRKQVTIQGGEGGVSLGRNYALPRRAELLNRAELESECASDRLRVYRAPSYPKLGPSQGSGQRSILVSTGPLLVRYTAQDRGLILHREKEKKNEDEPATQLLLVRHS